jgi:oligo-1,6-glucosidase
MRREVFDHYPGVVTLGEGFGLVGDQALDFVAPVRRELDLLFLFEISALTFAESGDRQRPSLADIRATLERWQDMLVPAGAWPTLFLANHDVARMVDRFGDTRPAHRMASAKLLTTLLLTQRGTPVLYQGDAIGMTNPRFGDVSEFRDVAVFNAWRQAVDAGGDTAALLARMNRTGRDTARTPMQWSADAHAGFTRDEPWIKVNPDHVNVNVAAQTGQPGSVLEHARTLLRLRRERAVLRRGEVQFLDVENPRVFAYERTLGSERLRVLLNWSDAPCRYRVDGGAAAWQPLLASLGDCRLDTDAAELRPFEALVLERRP